MGADSILSALKSSTDAVGSAARRAEAWQLRAIEAEAALKGLSQLYEELQRRHNVLRHEADLLVERHTELELTAKRCRQLLRQAGRCAETGDVLGPELLEAILDEVAR